MPSFLKSALRLATATALTSTTIHAGGLYLTELSTTETSLAGAGWAARAQDATTAFTNPGGMTQLEGTQIQFTAQPLFLNTEFNSDNGGGSDLDSWTPGGSLFITHQVNDDWSVGFSMAGFFGLGLDYDTGWDGRYYVDEITLQSIGFQPTVAYKINDQWSVGAGVALLYTEFEQKMSIKTAGDDGRLKLDDEDASVQVNLGIFYEPVEGTRFGVQYLSESDLELESRAKFSGVDGTLIGNALDNAGLLNSKVKLDMTLPQSIMFSAFHQVSPKFAIMGNIGWQEWSEFGKVDIDVSSNNPSSLSVNKDYNDTWHFAAGMQYQLTDQWRLNTGVAYDTAMVDDEDVTLDLPTGDSWRYGIGGTYAYSETLEFSAGYEIVWFGDVDADVNRGPLSGPVSGTFEDYAIHFFSVSVNWKM